MFLIFVPICGGFEKEHFVLLFFRSDVRHPEEGIINPFILKTS